MLIALWPALMQRRILQGRMIDADAGMPREIRGKAAPIPRPLSQIAAEEHLARLEAERGASDRDSSQPLDLGSVPSGIEPVGNAAVRIPRYERPVPGSLPAALGASFAASDAFPLDATVAMMQNAAKQADDDELAMITIMMGM